MWEELSEGVWVHVAAVILVKTQLFEPTRGIEAQRHLALAEPHGQPPLVVRKPPECICRSLGTWMHVVAAWARACIWSRLRHVRLQPPPHHVAGEVEAHGSGVRDRYANAAGCSSAIRRATDSPSTSIVSPPRAARCTQLSTCQHGARSAAERATHRTPRTESEADAR